MKLIYAKGACSLSVHILLEEIGLPYEAIRVSLEDKKVLDSYNPKSYVPALEIENGQILTEATNLLQYLSLENGGCFFPEGALERARCVEWMTYVSTELHKGFAPLFHKEGLKEEFLKTIKEKIHQRLSFMEEHLERSKFLMGKDYTIADMYALAILRIGENVGVDYEEYPRLAIYKATLESREIINRVIRNESKASIETNLRDNFKSYGKNSGNLAANLN